MNKTPNSELEDRLLLAYIAEARNDPLALSELLIAHSGLPVLRHPLQDMIARLLSHCIKGRRNLLIQAPPEHGKTSLVIPTLISEVARNPTLRAGIVSRDYDLAQEHLTKIRKAMLSLVCGAVFPELTPDHRMSAAGNKGEWSKVKLYLKGQSQPAFEAFPFTGGAEGHRLDLIWLDDVVTRGCLYSEAERKTAHSVIFDTFANRLTARGCLIVTNNCWHREDPIHEMRASESFSTLWIGYDGTTGIRWRLSHPPEGWDGEEEGIWPLWAQWPVDRLKSKMAEPGGAWRRLFEGRAIQPEDCRFPPSHEWARYDHSSISGDGVLYAFLDPSGGRNAHKGDFAALMVVARRSDGSLDLLDCRVDRVTPARQIGWAFEMSAKWRRLFPAGFQVVKVELLPKDELWIRDQFKAECDKRREAGTEWQVPFAVEYPREPKQARIERLEPGIREGWLRFPADLEERTRESADWRNLVNQLEEWPFGDHDDAPDALAGAEAASRLTGPAFSGDALRGVGIF